MGVTAGIKWIGVCTNKFEDTVSFFTGVMGLNIIQEGVPRIDIQYGKYCILDSKSDVMFEIFEPTEDIKDRYTGPVISFTVENLDQSCLEMENKVTFITDVITDNSTWRWRYFQAPDKNIYQIQEKL